jgi:branched-chain amino acid transport system permease protein
MSYFFQLVVSGIVVGSIYALAALGFRADLQIQPGAQYRPRADHCRWSIYHLRPDRLGGNSDLSLFLLSMIITFFLAMSVERIFLRRLIGEPIISVIMVTIGLMSILDGLIYLTPFGSCQFFFSPISTHYTHFIRRECLSPGPNWWGSSSPVLSLIAGFSWFFKKSTVGISMRAVSDDQLASMSIGISVPRVFGLAWAMAGLSAAAAGASSAILPGSILKPCKPSASPFFRWLSWVGSIPFWAPWWRGSSWVLIQQFASGYLDGNWGLNGTGRGAALCYFAGHSAFQTARAFRHP